MNKLLILIIASFLIFSGCEKSTEPPSGQGELRLYLVDSPGDYEEVNIVVKSVAVHKSDTDTITGWTIINNTPATYDLLKLRNGASAILGTAKLTAGHYTQIRLLIDSGSTVVVNGISYPLEIPSGMESGLKLTHAFWIESDKLYELTLDFDANKSIVKQGNNAYKLQPTIRVVANVISGTISGKVLPLDANALVQTLVGSDTVSTLPDTSGNFKLVALPEGTYSIKIIPGNSIYKDTTINNVSVVKQQDTNLGTITLQTN
ncbi:MAG: putative lipoprotein [Ignavibacteriae bacterium]|nr:MAG: putative lipoprotein [Ignavibacteriota bacterium]